MLLAFVPYGDFSYFNMGLFGMHSVDMNGLAIERPLMSTSTSLVN
jgi:hypothetical protein